jgi:hypothetical protein
VRRVLAAGATTGAVGAALFFAGCGGALEEPAPALDCAVPVEAGADVVSEDAGPGSWWIGLFDATVYSGFDPPVPGEYPASGAAACEYSGCFPEGTCDPQSGWCCSGRATEGQCSCGVEAGCVPPAVCCAVPGALELQCVATPDECPDAR